MKENLKKYTLCLILMCIIAIIDGIFMIMYPDISLATLGVMVALFMIAVGALFVYIDIKAWSYDVPFDGLLQGILRIILGILLLRNPDSMAVYIGIVLGVWMIMSSFGGIKLAYNLRYTSAPWILLIILNILNILIGVTVLYTPVLSSMALTTTVGMVIIIHAIINLFFIFEIRRNLNEVEKAVTAQLEQLRQEVRSEAQPENPEN